MLLAASLLGTPLPTSASPPRPMRPAPRGEGFGPIPAWTADGDQTDCRFGTVAPAGDVNGDGYDDVLVGSYAYDRPEVDEGVVFLYLGGAAGLSRSPAWTAESNQPGARLGDKLSGAGDVNGDGYDDVVIGAALYDSTHIDGGAAFVYLGSPAGLGTEPAWIAIGDQDYAEFGACAQAAGDVNADGYGDVIVGAWQYDHGELNEGRAFVYLGSDSGLADQPAWIGESDAFLAGYGYFCASAGDVNQDGFDDIVVGARRFGGNGLSEEGRVYVHHGSATGPSPTADWIRDGGRALAEFGAYAISAGDVNRDGCDDLLVGAFRYENPDLDEGKAWLFMGSPEGLSPVPAWEDEGDTPRNNFGYHLDGAGDVNGDGFADVVVSAPGVDPGDFTFYNAGQVSLYLGSASGLSAEPAWRQDGDQDYMSLEVVRGVGDVNGDGLADFATGSLYRDSLFVDSGRAFVFHGTLDARVGVTASHDAPAEVRLAGPNPFTGSTALRLSLSRACVVRMSVHDLQGRAIGAPKEGLLEAGEHRIEWDGRTADGHPAPPGIYLATVEAGAVARAIKWVRLK